MEFNWLTSETIEKSGAVVVALTALFVMLYITQRFSKILGNHLDHQTKMQEKDIVSRELYAAKFTTLVDTIQRYFEK